MASLVFAFALSACSAPPNVPMASNNATPSASLANPAAQVTISNDSFEPASVSVKAGQIVEWIWSDLGNPHDVTLPNGNHSPILASGKWSYRFSTPGTYHYYDSLHNKVAGTVVVTP